MIKLLVFTIVTTGMLDISEEISQFEMSHKLLVRMLYYVIDLAGCISEHQFVVFMHILKRTVHNWNNNIDAVK
jgi:hypothetical protein